MEYLSVPYTTYLSETLATLADSGLLLVSVSRSGKANVMTIGWGNIGVIWNRPVFTVLVRPSRHTFGYLEETGSFTVCVPPSGWQPVTEFCGARSGREHDKFQAMKLTASASQHTQAPGIAGCPVIYECQSVHAHDIDGERLDSAIKSGSYAHGDYHRVYHGQIVATRASADARQLLGT